jgi:hypothetical protein
MTRDFHIGLSPDVLSSIQHGVLRSNVRAPDVQDVDDGSSLDECSGDETRVALLHVLEG